MSQKENLWGPVMMPISQADAFALLFQRTADLNARLAKLESQQPPGLSDPDPCAEFGLCLVDLFRPVDDTEGSV